MQGRDVLDDLSVCVCLNMCVIETEKLDDYSM